MRNNQLTTDDVPKGFIDGSAALRTEAYIEEQADIRKKLAALNKEEWDAVANEYFGPEQ